MERECAVLLARYVSAIDLLLGNAAATIDEFPPSEIGRQVKRGIGELIIEMHERVSIPIATLYPDLHPDSSSP